MDSLEASGAADVAGLTECPIPGEWIREGAPVARIKELSKASTDGNTSTFMWDCTAGRFQWHFDCDETLFVLEGGVTVTMPSGEIRRLSAGSTCFFPKGSSSEWHVDRYIRKICFCCNPMSAKLRLAKRTYTALRDVASLRVLRPAGSGSRLSAT